ncbi:MAG: ClbS/DfsB family four-helix bundle protein, partial [Chloroflexi bacterium]|nr:ClbS/DfsB family four-helix bundle protein [Chloroflexota bacterium]
MTEPEIRPDRLRAGLIEGLRESRAVERDVFAALEPTVRDTVPAGAGWSAKDTLAHLSAWRQRETDRLVALREGREEPPAPAAELDAINAVFHDQRADWDWERVADDAESTADSLLAEIAAASDETLADEKVVGSILGDGPEHDLGHLAELAPTEALRSRVVG